MVLSMIGGKFLEAINDKVYHATYSEDKKLGYFFCKAKDGVISADKFVSRLSSIFGTMCSKTLNLRRYL